MATDVFVNSISFVSFNRTASIHAAYAGTLLRHRIQGQKLSTFCVTWQITGPWPWGMQTRQKKMLQRQFIRRLLYLT